MCNLNRIFFGSYLKNTIIVWSNSFLKHLNWNETEASYFLRLDRLKVFNEFEGKMQSVAKSSCTKIHNIHQHLPQHFVLGNLTSLF